MGNPNSDARAMLDDEGGLRELRLLYNHAEDDSRQFTRWQMVTAINHGIRLARADAYEQAARVCEQQARDFLSEQYAVGQPMSSISERFACQECATAIRALSDQPDSDGEGENWLQARVSQDAKTIGIDHPTEADWQEVLRAHIVLRDRLNKRIAEQQKCPHRPSDQPDSTNEGLAELLRALREARIDLDLARNRLNACAVTAIASGLHREQYEWSEWNREATVAVEKIDTALATGRQA